MIVAQLHKLRWYAHVLRRVEKDLVKKYMYYNRKGVRPKGRPKKTCS